jgi:hypothetical protein
VIRFQYNEGWRIIQSCLYKRTNNNKVPEVLQAFECLLCFDAWLIKSHYWDTSNPEHVPQETRSTQASIWKFMMMCKKSIPIDKDNVWKYPKFQELPHIVDAMSRFGSPLNFCSLGPESLLKDTAKHPRRRAQKHHEGSSTLLREWEWSPDYLLVSGNTVVGPCFVISISHNSSKVLGAKPTEEWDDKFT